MEIGQLSVPRRVSLSTVPARATSRLWSVVVPTKNRPESLRSLLRTILLQEPAPREIVVVDQSSIPTDLGAVLTFVGAGRNSVRLICVHDPTIDGAAAARNAGLALATAPYVVFMDDDAVPEPNCLPLLIEALERDGRLPAAAGLVSNYSAPPLWIRCFRRFFYLGPLYDERQAIYWRARRYRPGQLIPTTKLNGGCMAVRREAILAIGGFDPAYRGPSVGEDIEISQRLLRLGQGGDSLAFVAGAFIHHASEGTWKSNPRALEYEMVATHYWFKKTHPWHLGNRLRFYWMSLGLLLWSVSSACKRRSTAPLRTFKAALTTIANDYRDCPFLKPGGGEPGK